MLKSIQFMPQARAVEVQPSHDKAMISITGPASEAPLKNGWTHLQRLEFHDADKVEFEGCLLFDESVAKQVIHFVEGLPEEVEHLIVHCHAGVSRSGAVAKFIAEMKDLPFNHDYPSFNRLVYRTLSNTYFGMPFDVNNSAFALPTSKPKTM
jgi:predicted protein tyrosine phosphatase